MKSPILGGEYITRSASAGYNRAINLFPEAIAEGGKEPGFLSRCPGLKKITTVGTGPIRGAIQAGGNVYIISGNTFYKVTPAYAITTEGTVDSGLSPASMAFNGVQVMMSTNPKAYIYNTSTDTFAEVTDADFPGSGTVDYLDGYFIFNDPATQKFYITSLLDGTSIDPLDFASAEGYPDDIVAIKVSHRELWVFGENSVEVFYNSGNADFPFQRIAGAFIEAGCAAPNSIAKLDNSLFWLGNDARGKGLIYRANGYSAVRISNHSVETLIHSFDVTIDAIGYAYQQAGHSFYMLSFPTEGRTLCYDVSTELWHERAYYSNGQFYEHRSRCMFMFNENVHVGDRLNGNIYTFDLDYFYDGDKPQKWLRSWRAIPTGKNTLKRMIHHQLQLDCEVGVGLNSGLGRDAEVVLRWSDDGGHTFGNPHILSIGKIGERMRKVIWKRLGISRDRMYEVSGSDPVKIIIMGAELQATQLKT